MRVACPLFLFILWPFRRVSTFWLLLSSSVQTESPRGLNNEKKNKIKNRTTTDDRDRKEVVRERERLLCVCLWHVIGVSPVMEHVAEHPNLFLFFLFFLSFSPDSLWRRIRPQQQQQTFTPFFGQIHTTTNQTNTKKRKWGTQKLRWHRRRHAYRIPLAHFNTISPVSPCPKWDDVTQKLPARPTTPFLAYRNPKPLGYAVTQSAPQHFFQMGIESDRESRRSVDGLISRELEPLGGKNNRKRSF